MHKYSLTLLFLLSLQLLFGQGKFNLENQILLDSLPSVKGQFLNYSSDFDKNVFVNYTVLTPEFRNIIQRTATISEDGSFSIQIDQVFPYQKVILQIGDYYKGYLIANQDVKVNIDLNDLTKRRDDFANKAIVYEGTDRDLNQFYNEYLDYKIDKRSEIRKMKFSSLMNRTSQVEYKVSQVRAFYQDLKKIDDQFIKKYGREHAWLLENERDSEMYGDIAYIFIGKQMKTDLWNECLNHQPLVISELSNRFYGILALKLWSHEEKEIRALSRIIYNGDNDDPEEKKEVNLFLAEQDKKKAGLSYDNEIFAAGLEKFIKKYEDQVEQAKVDLYISKLSKIPASKIGLVGIKGQPLDIVQREKYLENFLPIVPVDWQKNLAITELEDYKQWVESISEDIKGRTTDDAGLGSNKVEMITGAVTWQSGNESVQGLLAKIRNYFPGKALILYIWDTDCTSCIEELTLAGRTYDKLLDEPMTLVTLTINKNDGSDKWRKVLKDTYAQGHHILLNRKLSSEIFDYLQLPPVPAYIYFDEAGNFVPNKIFSIEEVDVNEVLSEG